jgi:hypothetical protein
MCWQSHWQWRTEPAHESSCIAACTGAVAEQYYLASKSESGVKPDPKGVLDVLKSEATKLPEGTIQALFTLRLPEGVSAKNYIVDCM